MSEEDMSALCAEDSMLSNNCIHCAYVESCLLFQKRSMGVAGKTKVIDQINFMLTMACSLNCKSCGALVPECKKKHYVGTMTFVEIKDYVNKISQAGYYIHQLMFQNLCQLHNNSHHYYIFDMHQPFALDLNH